jgi:thioesterase domain-containing protein/acyl carrier protein
VRLVVTGSERVAPEALALWRRIAPGVAWINAYGPTEATITAVAHRLDPADPAPDPGEEVPIGRPLAHATARILAFDGTLAPEGAPGELALGGPAVALGYLDRPDETARAFRRAEGGARLYATGDRAAWRADGRLAFLGRRDRQVKLRGHRIDLGGVERALGALPGVRAVHVAADPDGAARVLAWVAGPAAAEGPEGLARLRAAAARRLPAYALPVLVPVADLPLRANGKIDPDRLPRPLPGPAAAAPRAPAQGLAADVAAIMAEVLSLDQVDPDTDFRDLGGHSLAALRLAGAIESRFGRRTRTTDLYRHPTARAMAAHLAAPAVDGPRYLVPICTDGPGVPFYAVHVLGEKESLYRPLAAAMAGVRPVWGLTMGPPKDPDAVSIHAVARAYFEDLQRHHPTGPLALGAVSMAAYFAFELAQMLRAAGREVSLLAVFDAEGPDGRPALTGRARLAAHLHQMRRHGLGHLRAVLRTRLDRVRFARDLALSGPEQVNGAALVWANVRAVEAYRPEPYLGRIAVFRAADSFWDSPAALASCLGWEPVARGGIEMHDIPGDHLTILQTGNVERIAAQLQRLLPLS